MLSSTIIAPFVKIGDRNFNDTGKRYNILDNKI